MALDPETADDAQGGPGRNALFAAIQSTRMPMILTDPHQHDNPIIFANRAFVELSGYPEDELVGRNCRFLQGEETSPEAVAKIRHAVATRTKIAVDIVNYSKDGRRFVNELYISPVFSPRDQLLYFFGSQVDVTAYTEARLSLQLTLVERERFVLSQIAEGIPLGRVLDDLLRSVEARNEGGMRTSILFLSEDGEHLRHGAAPSLPAAFNEAIDGMSIGEAMGSCGTAVSRGQPVYAADIASDPLWVGFRDLALSHGLRACWSTPIISAGKGVLGTFAVYYDLPRSPTQDEIAAIGFVTQTAALAIERHRNEVSLRRGEERLREVNEALEAANRRLQENNEHLERTVAERTKAVRLFGDIVQSDVSPILAFGQDYRVIGFNRAHRDDFLRVMGHEQRIDDDLLALFPPEQATVLRSLMERALAGEAFSVVQEFGDLDRVMPTWEIAYTPLRDEGGAVVGAFHHARDISDRLRAERKLAGLQDQLMQSQKMEAVGQLTGGVAHDFNNLLTVIRSSVDLLKRPNLAEERRARYVAAISDTVDRAAKLTGQLLAFARRQALKPEVFSVGDSVRALSGMMGTLTGSRIKVTTDLTRLPCHVSADPSQFDTALVNLAVNARDAMDGEGRIAIAVRAVETLPAVRAHAAIDAPYVAVSLSDTGSGIPADRIERIFEPFFTTKGVGKGTGLGLSQVFGFVKQSGGDITVDSTVGVGTTFTLYLPRVPASDAPAVVEEPETLIDGRGTRVLVVEDNDDVGTFAVQSLTDLGYVTMLAIDGLAALAELAKDDKRFDVVFSDVMMPGMTGIELGQEIRRLYQDLPVVLTSGYSHVLAQNGTYGFELLHKPYSVEQLSQILRKAATWRRRKRILGA